MSSCCFNAQLSGKLGRCWLKSCPITSCLFTTYVNGGSSLPSSVQPGRCPQEDLIVPQVWTVYRAFDLTWKELIDFCVTGSVRGKGKKKKEMHAGHFTTCAGISERENEREKEEGGRGWRERSPHTRLHPCSITIIWLTWAGRRGSGRGEESRCVEEERGRGGGEGIPALGDHSSYLELRYEKTDLMSGFPRSAAWGLVKVVVQKRPHFQPPTLHLQHLMTSTWNEETRDWWRSLVNVSVSLPTTCVSPYKLIHKFDFQSLSCLRSRKV